MDKNNKKTDSKKVLKRLFSFLSPYKFGLIISIIFIIISSIINSLSPFILGRATDSILHLFINGNKNYENFNRFISILILLSIMYILFSIFKYIGSLILVKISQKTIFDLRSAVDKKIKKLPLNYFDTNSYGDILSRITNDVDLISNSLQQSFEQLISSFTTSIFMLTMMFYISPILTLIGIITIPLSLIFSIKIAKKSRVYFGKQQEILGKLNGYVEEVYTGHNIVIAFGTEEKTIENFEKQNENLYESGLRAQFLSSILMPITSVMSNLGYVLVVVISAFQVINGKISIGMIQSFIQYLKQFTGPIIQTVQIANILQSTIAAGDRVFEFLDEKEEISDENLEKIPNYNNPTIEFKDVKFGYLENKTLMEKVSLKVENGKKVAIVGPTGAGKTTLINLLLRFYDVNSGSITIDGIDIREMKRENLRKIFGMVLQDTWLFTGTIMENLRYGKLDATDEEIIEAAKLARADTFINILPDGYNFMLQEGATNLAQGERQLLTIARAILSNSPIMVLDEATSSVDTRTEILIQEAMKNLMKNRTSFVIAHRLSTIKDSDMIIYMESGDIKEIGTHEELILKKGLYENLYNSQFA